MLARSNELPLRTNIKKLDGDTSGPRGLNELIDQQLSVDHKTLKIADYPPVKVQVISFAESETQKLSTDQKYLLIASNAVILKKTIWIKTPYTF